MQNKQISDLFCVTRTPLINSALWRRQSMLMVHKKMCFPSAMTTKGANDISQQKQCPYLAISMKNIWKPNPSWHHSNKFLGSFACKLDKCFFHNILYIFWLCKIHYTKNNVNVKVIIIWPLYFSLQNAVSLCSFDYDLMLWRNIWLQKRLIWQGC